MTFNIALYRFKSAWWIHFGTRPAGFNNHTPIGTWMICWTLICWQWIHWRCSWFSQIKESQNSYRFTRVKWVKAA